MADTISDECWEEVMQGYTRWRWVWLVLGLLIVLGGLSIRDTGLDASQIAEFGIAPVWIANSTDEVADIAAGGPTSTHTIDHHEIDLAIGGVVALPPMMPPDTIGCVIGQSNDDPFCIDVVTGTIRSQYRISHPDGVTAFTPLTLANFEQKIIGSGAGYLDVEVSSKLWVDTERVYDIVCN